MNQQRLAVSQSKSRLNTAGWNRQSLGDQEGILWLWDANLSRGCHGNEWCSCSSSQKMGVLLLMGVVCHDVIPLLSLMASTCVDRSDYVIKSRDAADGPPSCRRTFSPPHPVHWTLCLHLAARGFFNTRSAVNPQLLCWLEIWVFAYWHRSTMLLDTRL